MQHETKRSSKIKQSKQSLLEEREKRGFTSEVRVARKTQESMVANKEMKAATNDMHVHSSRSEDATVVEYRKKITDRPPAKRKSNLSQSI